MSRTWKIAALAAVIVLAAAVVLLLGRDADPAAVALEESPPAAGEPFAQPGAEADAQQRVVIGHARGAPAAPVTVIEFADFGCGYCAKFALETYPELHREYVESGKVQWIYVPFVLGMFTNGEEAAVASECAAVQGGDAFWRMHDHLFEQQAEWKKSRSPLPLFAGYAAALGLDRAQFDACQQGDAVRPKITGGNISARQSGVRATPTFFINGGMLEGAPPVATFREVLNQVLSEAGITR